MKAYEEWKEKHKVKDCKAGDKLDVRDTLHIWCIGVVEMIVHGPQDRTLYYIHYMGWDRKWDEYIVSNSKRLSPLGLYSNRKDIPKYDMNPYSHNNVLFAQIIEGSEPVSNRQRRSHEIEGNNEEAEDEVSVEDD